MWHGTEQKYPLTETEKTAINLSRENIVTAEFFFKEKEYKWFIERLVQIVYFSSLTFKLREIEP